MLQTRNRLLERIVAPSAEPIVIDDAKLYLRVDHTEEDNLISDMIVAARMTAESWMNRSLMEQTWKLAYDEYLPEVVSLPMGPVREIIGVTIFSRNEEEDTQEISPDVYYLNASKNLLVFYTVLIGFRIEIEYTAGYGYSSGVPAPIRQGMLSHIAAMYDARGENGVVALPAQAERLYMPYREVRL